MNHAPPLPSSTRMGWSSLSHRPPTDLDSPHYPTAGLMGHRPCLRLYWGWYICLTHHLSYWQLPAGKDSVSLKPGLLEAPTSLPL